jgi:hypothetical protein
VAVVVLQSSYCKFVDIELLRWTYNGDTLDLQWSHNESNEPTMTKNHQMRTKLTNLKNEQAQKGPKPAKNGRKMPGMAHNDQKPPNADKIEV